MDVTCDDFCGQAFWPGTGSCRPTTSFDFVFLEHGTLALVQLAKSAWLAVWLLNMPRRTVTRLVGSTTALARLDEPHGLQPGARRREFARRTARVRHLPLV